MGLLPFFTLVLHESINVVDFLIYIVLVLSKLHFVMDGKAI